MRSVLVVLVFGGCGGLTYYGDRLRGVPSDGGGATGDTGVIGTPTAGAPLAIDAVAPAFGTNAGGTEVIVSGQFDDDTVLGFGGREATISSRTATQLVAVVPASADTGPVDVTVASGARSAVLEGGYEYWADGTGRAGTFGFAELYHMVGGYWSDPNDFAAASFGFIEPSDWEPYLEYATALDTCSAVDAYTAEPAWIVTGAAAWEFEANGPSFELPEDPDVPGLFASDAVLAPVPVNEVVAGASYDLHAQPANAAWPINDLASAVTIPSAFTVSAPNLAAAAAPPQKKNTFTITWSGSGGDYVMILLMRRDVPTPTIVTCAANDDGEFLVPGATWATWPVGVFMDVLVGRVVVDRGLLPTNNAENRVAGVYWVYGGVVTD